MTQSNFFQTCRKFRIIKEKIFYLFGPPGWSHDGSRLTSEQLRMQEDQLPAETKINPALEIEEEALAPMTSIIKPQ